MLGRWVGGQRALGHSCTENRLEETEATFLEERMRQDFILKAV